MSMFQNLFSFLAENSFDADFLPCLRGRISLCPRQQQLGASQHGQFVLQWQNPSGEPHLESQACSVKTGSTVLSRAKDWRCSGEMREKCNLWLPVWPGVPLHSAEMMNCQSPSMDHGAHWKNWVCFQLGIPEKNQHCSEPGKICNKCGLINGRACETQSSH